MYVPSATGLKVANIAIWTLPIKVANIAMAIDFQ